MSRMRQKLQQISAEAWMKGYILLFSIVLLGFTMLFGADNHSGEWDDYSMVSISLINEQNFGVSESDIAMAKEWFPNWCSDIEQYSLSGYHNRSGEEMAWYFPVYSLACVPFLLLLRLVHLPAEYAFRLTNYAVLVLMVCFVYRKCRLEKPWKWLLLFLLSASPVLLYVPWVSAEVFIYAMLVMGCMCWVNREYCRAALFVSIAGMLNPVIMFAGMVMIVEYLGVLYKERRGGSGNAVRVWLREWKGILKYGCCFIPGIVPLVYNYYQVGHINLTASLDGFVTSDTTTFRRFWAYLTDWNFGILPYYGILFLIACAVAVLAVRRKKYRYAGMFAAFLGVMYLYSIMVHINSGMSGISRYNAWNAAILIVMTVYGLAEVWNFGKGRTRAGIAITVGNVIALAITGLLVVGKTNYMYMGPVAAQILNHCPSWYDPLPSTFYSRIAHVDGGYDYPLPLYYQDGDGEVRKILVSEDSAQMVRDELTGSEEDVRWLEEKLLRVEGEQYISVEPRHHLRRKE